MATEYRWMQEDGQLWAEGADWSVGLIVHVTDEVPDHGSLLAARWIVSEQHNGHGYAVHMLVAKARLRGQGGYATGGDYDIEAKEDAIAECAKRYEDSRRRYEMSRF